MEANAAMQIEVREHDRRISGLHKTLGGIAADVGGNKTDIEVLKRDVREARSDVDDLKQTIEREGEKNRRALAASDAKFAEALKESDEKFRTASNKMVGALVGFSLTAAGSAIAVLISTGGHP